MSTQAITVVGMASDSIDVLREKASHVRGGVVFDATHSSTLQNWQDVERLLTEAFAAVKDAKERDVNLVAVVRTDDEFGRQGPFAAMVACALTSAIRTLALEARDLTMTANIVADSGEDSDALLNTVCQLLESSVVTGQVIVVGRGHLGKVPV